MFRGGRSSASGSWDLGLEDFRSLGFTALGSEPSV